MDEAHNGVPRPDDSAALSRPARRLLDLITGAMAAGAGAWMEESWFAQQMGCCSGRLRRYRGELVAAGLVRMRRHGPYLHIELVEQIAAEREKCDAVLGWVIDAREKCDAVSVEMTKERAKSVTLEDLERKKCDALLPKRHTFCDDRAPVPPVPLVDGREVGRLININQDINPTYLPEKGDARGENLRLSREALASENTEHPDYERNRRFLEDSELGITKDASIEWLARNYQWEDLLPQVFAALRDATARAGTQSSVRSLGGWIVNRLNNHLRSPKNYRATPLTAAEMRSPLYRRHMVMCVPEAEEISPAGASPVAAEDAQQPELPGLDGSQGSLICADGQTWSQVWARCRDELRLQMTGSTWEMWIRDTKAAQDGDLLAVVCKDAQVRDWLSQRLRQTILRTVAAAVGRQIELAFIIDEGGKQ